MIDKCELMLAELHHVLKLKQANHGLDENDVYYFEFSEKYYDLRKGELDLERIELDLVKARLKGEAYVSQVTGKVINRDHAGWAVYQLERWENKQVKTPQSR